ncbi:hypothetical protein [Enterobacter quasiroggenkampii]|uniref:hypothetical protein n=1 Tax=Enterobacter quasiroggenkampii TaxID=2497436 RepID=UPI0021D1EAB1|nr:hypothetical protein [Enterobacter quasiroggenkampii]MCU6407867.1 hypothetical protein [Enterobacter quasiroggenkampii]
MSNIDKHIDIQALRTDLLIANALETAKQLRELQESSVAAAIVESMVENENGKEIQFERPISDLAFAAFWQLKKLVEALEAAEKRIAELVARQGVMRSFCKHQFYWDVSNVQRCARCDISIPAAAGKGE